MPKQLLWTLLYSLTSILFSVISVYSLFLLLHNICIVIWLINRDIRQRQRRRNKEAGRDKERTGGQQGVNVKWRGDRGGIWNVTANSEIGCLEKATETAANFTPELDLMWTIIRVGPFQCFKWAHAPKRTVLSCSLPLLNLTIITYNCLMLLTTCFWWRISTLWWQFGALLYRLPLCNMCDVLACNSLLKTK